MHRPASRVLVAVACALAVVMLSACRAAPAPAPSARDARPPLEIVFAEPGDGETVFWAARAEEPAERRRVARVSHAPDWGVRGALSPNGRYLAYSFMPRSARDPDREAILSMLDLRSRTSHRILSGIDLRTTPVWYPDSGRVVVQRLDPMGVGRLEQVTLDGQTTVLAAAEPGHRLAPAGVLPGGRELLAADLSRGEGWLRAFRDEDTARTVAWLGDSPIRAFALSADGRALALLRLEGPEREKRYRAVGVDLASGDEWPVAPEVERIEDTGLAWTGPGALAVSGFAGEAGGILLRAGRLAPRGSDAGFDALVSASPDGRYLLARSFEWGDPRAPGPERLVMIRPDGGRVDIGAGLTAVGWTGG